MHAPASPSGPAPVVVAPDAGLTEQLARFAVGTEPPDLPAVVVQATRRIVLDTVACGLGATATPAGRMIVDLKRELGGRPDATLMADGGRFPATSVAYAHAQLANLLDADETLLNWGHFASVIVMPALALGEMVGASGAEVVTAVAVGFDVAARVGLSLPDYEISPAGDVRLAGHRGFSWAAFGTAAVAGRLLGLGVDEMCHAFGLAFVHTPVHGCLALCTRTAKADAAWHKYAMYGAIAEAGVTSALLAGKGFHAVADLFEEKNEFWKAFGAGSCDPKVLVGDLSSRWYIAETSIKPYPFCRFGHGALDLFTSILAEEALTAGDIDAVRVTLPPLHVCHMLAGTTTVESPFNVMNSLPYAFAVIAAGIPPGPRWVDPAQVTSRDHRAFAERFSYVIDVENGSAFVDQVRSEGKFTRVPTTVEVRSGGRRYTRSCEYARGDPFGPDQMTDQELVDKVREFAAGVVGRQAIEQLIEAALVLDTAPDLSRLVAGFGGQMP